MTWSAAYMQVKSLLNVTRCRKIVNDFCWSFWLVRRRKSPSKYSSADGRRRASDTKMEKLRSHTSIKPVTVKVRNQNRKNNTGWHTCIPGTEGDRSGQIKLCERIAWFLIYATISLYLIPCWLICLGRFGAKSSVLMDHMNGSLIFI